MKKSVKDLEKRYSFVVHKHAHEEGHIVALEELNALNIELSKRMETTILFAKQLISIKKPVPTILLHEELIPEISSEIIDDTCYGVLLEILGDFFQLINNKDLLRWKPRIDENFEYILILNYELTHFFKTQNIFNVIIWKNVSFIEPELRLHSRLNTKLTRAIYDRTFFLVTASTYSEHLKSASMNGYLSPETFHALDVELNDFHRELKLHHCSKKLFYYDSTRHLNEALDPSMLLIYNFNKLMRINFDISHEEAFKISSIVHFRYIGPITLPSLKNKLKKFENKHGPFLIKLFTLRYKKIAALKNNNNLIFPRLSKYFSDL